MRETGVQRQIFVSSMGIFGEVPGEAYRSILGSYRDSAAIVEASDLNCTAPRPGWFTPDREVNRRITRKGQPFPDHDVSLESLSDLIVKRLTRAHKTPRKLAERARMILLAGAGTAVHATARQLGVWPKTVRHWRARWLASPVEAPVAALLSDAARPGTPATFTPEQVCAIMALACESPDEKSNLPLSHWSQSELAREAVRRGIADSISHGSVGRFLKERPTSNRIACAAG
jgi:hypothetical protein